MNGKITLLIILTILGGVGFTTYLWLGQSEPTPEDLPSPKGISDFEPAKLTPVKPEDVVSDPVFKIAVVRDQILVSMHDQWGETELKSILQLLSPDSRVIGRIPVVNTFQISVDPASRHALTQKLDNHPWIQSATFNVVRQKLKSFNDPFINDPEKGWGIKRINAEQAWDISTGEKTKIAIVDSGTRVTHEEFVGKIVDAHSYATNSDSMQLKEYYGEIKDENGRVVGYYHDRVAGHGTHVAGTASGNAGNSKGTAGIAPDAELMPVQVLYFLPNKEKSKHKGLDVGSVLGGRADIVAGIARAIAKGADVINLSLGPKYPESLIDAYNEGSAEFKKKVENEIFIPNRDKGIKAYGKVFDLAKKHNVILVNASGNDDIPAIFDPLSYSKRTISVAATTPDDQRANFSNHGAYTLVSAPGVNIHSAFSSADDGYFNMPGTSMACPHVAGVVALMRSVHPDMTFEQARDILVRTGTKLKTDKPIGPLVNAAKAVKEAKRSKEENEQPPEDEPPIVEPPIIDPPTEEKPPSDKPPTEQPPETKPPTAEQIINGPEPWKNPQVQNLIDLWLSIATPVIKPVPGHPWFYDEWGRALNNKTAWAFIPPDHGAMTRHQWVWQFAKKLRSTRHGTLYEFVLGMLRSGSFNPAPVEIPEPPGNPTNPNPGNDRPGNPDAGQPKPGVDKPQPGNNNPNDPGKPETPKPNTPDPQQFTFDSLQGLWTGKNGKDVEMGLKIFDDQTVWVIRNGNASPYKPHFKFDQLPAVLELSAADMVAMRIAVERVDNDTLKVATYFNRSVRKFRANDIHYTYLLKRESTDVSDNNPARHGYQSASIKLNSVESVIVGSPDKNRRRGIGFVMPSAYKVVRNVLSRDGAVAWIVIDNPYPAKGTKREQQIWSVETKTGKATRSAISVKDAWVNDIRTTPDGKYCWAVMDYSLPAAVQPIREFKIYRANRGNGFKLIADTGSDKNIGKLGLAQKYDPHATADGSSLIFNDGSTIWRASSSGFSKVITREQMLSGNMKLVGYNGPREFKVSANDQQWIALMTMKEGSKTIRTVVYGTLAGTSRVIAKTDKHFSNPNISPDGRIVSFFDYSNYKTKIGTPGNYRELKTVGKYHSYAPVFSGNAGKIYGVIGFKGTGNIASGFVEDIKSGKRTFSHSGMMVPPSPGKMNFSDNALIKSTVLGGVELAKIESGNQIHSGHPELEEVLFRIQGDRLHCRIKASNPDDVGSIAINYLHQDYVASGYALDYKLNPFGYWSGLTRTKPNKQFVGYFDQQTPVKDTVHDDLKSATFLVSIQSKTKNHVSNYLVQLR